MSTDGRRRTRRTWQEPFLASLREGHTVSHACKDAGITPSTAYQARGVDPDFFAEWDDALETGTDLLEEEAWRRAKEGTPEPVFYQGEIVGHVVKFSDNLLLELLRSRRPEKYRQRQDNRHAGDARPLSAEDLDLARRLGQNPDLEGNFESLAQALAEEARKAAP
jgi:hypothetical protein